MKFLTHTQGRSLVTEAALQTVAYQEEHSSPPVPAGKPDCLHVSSPALPQERSVSAPVSCCGRPLRCRLEWKVCVLELVDRQKQKKQQICILIILIYRRQSWGSISDRRQFGADTAWCSSCSQSAPPPRPSLRRHPPPQPPPRLHHRFPPLLPPLVCFSSVWLLPKKIGPFRSVKFCVLFFNLCVPHIILSFFLLGLLTHPR